MIAYAAVFQNRQVNFSMLYVFLVISNLVIGRSVLDVLCS